jgi:2-methylcitrate dehydratase PrpD
MNLEKALNPRQDDRREATMDDRTHNPTLTGTGLTEALAARAQALRYEQLSPEARELVRQCVLDYIAVTLAGADEPLTNIVLAELAEQSGAPHATVFLHGGKLPALSTALVNGTAAHALDYDDVNLAMPGHPSVAILPALLALAEETHASGADLIAAFVAGYELQCRAGQLVAPAHYDHGFHATGTIGAFGAAAACAHLLKLDAERTAHALGIAGTQASGLRSLFGTMGKPFHAGKAAYNGLLAARLAKRGFVARPDVLECEQGFARTHSADFNPERALAPPPLGLYLRANLFKYHAACYLTHAAIEAARRLKAEHAITPEQVTSVRIRVDRGCAGVCNIAEPRTGLEAKFSLRFTMALALAGADTSALSVFADDVTHDADLNRLRDKVTVEFATGWPHTLTEIEIGLIDGRAVAARYDSGVPAADVDEQGRRLEEKFTALVAPLLGDDRAATLRERIARLDQIQDVGELTEMCVQ